ncbi:MAG: TIGR00645 family protein [Bauldia sp.]|nr:TIGR00645 family protein [Bauldia sp.]
MKAFENAIEKTIMGARWLLVIFYLGLGAALVVYAASFIYKFVKVASGVFAYEEGEMILAMLGLIDAALVASLLVMVMISSYENYVSRLDNAGTELSWLGKLDSGSLKIKVASSIVAISSIHLLQVFLNATHYTDTKIVMFMLLHLTFVVSALLLAYVDRISSKTKDPKQP